MPDRFVVGLIRSSLYSMLGRFGDDHRVSVVADVDCPRGAAAGDWWSAG